MSWSLLTNFIKWVHDEIARMHALIEEVRTRAGLEPSEQTPKPPDVQQAVDNANNAGATTEAPPAQVVFDPSPYPDDASRYAAFTEFRSHYPITTPIVDPHGNPIDVTGNSILTAGGSGAPTYPSGDDLTNFSQPLVNTMQAGQTFVYKLNPPAGTPAFQFAVVQVVGTLARLASVTVKDAAGAVVWGPMNINATSGGATTGIPYSGGTYTAEVVPDETGPLGGQMYLA